MSFMDIAARLTHKAQWVRPSNDSPTVDKYGDLTQADSLTDITTVSCYCYQDYQNKYNAPFVLTNANQWIVVLPKERTDIVVDQQLRHITDRDGVLLLSAGRIVRRTILNHHRDGTRVIYCLVEPN